MARTRSRRTALPAARGRSSPCAGPDYLVGWEMRVNAHGEQHVQVGEEAVLMHTSMDVYRSICIL